MTCFIYRIQLQSFKIPKKYFLFQNKSLKLIKALIINEINKTIFHLVVKENI